MTDKSPEPSKLRILGPVWVTVIALVSTVFAIYSLSAFQVQVRIQSFSSKGLSYSVWNIDRLIKRQEAREREIEPLEKALKALQEEVAQREAVRSRLQAKYWEQGSQLDMILHRLLARVKERERSFVPNPESFGYERFSLLRVKLQELGLADETIQKNIATYEVAYTEADRTYSELSALEPGCVKTLGLL